ncbi:hypothetical protein SDC9_08680 [bioreactor metagenome]|uniref:Outer membrane protein beta-barrel domain-containing protein n=1 Tax=bioreactor metagenome TaxID=1076179 RepID=A0A644T8A9_9ZZZZ|nr:porin family protein [Lentimicrobium sp.]MEA5109279.1 porin family protein [Lentimicrobium sp.]
MKNYLIAILVLFTFSATAQVPYFTIGPKAGASFSKFSADEDQIKEEMKSSLHFGAFARIGDKVYLQPELLFMNRKGDLSQTAVAGSTKSLHIKTLDIPVLLGGKLIDTDLFNVRVMAGPVASLALNKDINSENWDNTITGKDIRAANWGVQTGAGVDLQMFTLDLRYEFGISDYSKDEGLTLKNNMFTVSLGWKIL